jgi:serine O-acetyltransferase
MRRLEKCIELMMKSYRDYGLLNHSRGANLPSRESIQDILRNLDELIFPGFREQVDLDNENLGLITGERINRLARELIREVEKSIGFALRLGRNSEEGPPDYSGCRAAAEIVVEEFFEELPNIRGLLALDLEAAFQGDPAALSSDEIILSYPGFYAVAVHRIAHFFYSRQVPLIPRMMSEIVHGRTGIDIHPGAEIGEAFFIDHGTGVVIGETAVIGKNVKIYQGVTLGAVSVSKKEAGKKRHPTIEDNVTIYANATILGGKTVIGKGCIIGGSSWITHSVKPGTTVYAQAPSSGPPETAVK